MTPRCKPNSCLGCDCFSHGTDFMQVTGSGSFGIGLIGEAPGEMEAREQRGFIEWAPAGSVLERTLRRLGYSRDQFFIANTIFCRPRENFLDGAPWEFPAIRHCQPNLLGALRQHKPKILVALGGISFRTLTGISGKQRGVSHMRGYVFRALPEYCDAASNPDLLVIPTYHPSFLRRGAIHLTGVFARDIQRAVNIRAGKDKSFILDMPLMQAVDDLDDPFNSPEEQHDASTVQASIVSWMQQHNLNYVLHPTLQQLDSFCREVKQKSDAWQALSPDMQKASTLALSYDLETQESTDLDEDESDGFSDTIIKLAQFSIAPTTGISFPWRNNFIQATRWLLKLPLPKVGHNCFAKNTSVWMADGSWRPIWKIKIGERVRTIKDGLLTTRAVSWRFETKDERKWLEVRVCGGYNRGVGKWGNSGVVCTPDHEWLLENGRKIRASRLQPGMRVPIPRQGQEDLIIGCANGDGYIAEIQPRLVLSHTNKGWTEAKAKAFGVPCRQEENHDNWAASKYKWTMAVTVPSYYRILHYKGKQKTFVPMNPRSLAIFYGDDGCLHHRKKKNPNVQLAMHKFSTEKEIVKKWFTERYGYCAYHSGLTLSLSVDASRKFFEEIAEYLHPSMEYKLPEAYRGRYNGWMDELEVQIGLVESVKPIEVKHQPRNKYCLEVEDTHTFFTRHGLVSNCWLFDNRVLSAVGQRDYGSKAYFQPNGTIHDTMQLLHFWQPDIPAHLQSAASYVQFPFAWKHLSGSNLEFYGNVDVDATLRVYQMMRKTLPERGIWDDPVTGRNASGYVNQVEAVRPILAAMEDRGFPVDNERRLALDVEFEAAEKEARAELDQRFPEEARKLDPKLGYKGIPPRVKLLLAEGMTEEEIFARQFQDTSKKNDAGELQPGEFFFFKRREFKVPIVAENGEPSTELVTRWCRVYAFSPNSAPQLKQYMEAKGHKIPKKKTGEDTTGKIELARVASKHKDDFYTKVVECREIRKMRGTYIDGYKPQADGMAHTTFTFATSTGQLTSRNPVNLTNIPKHGRLAKPIRSMFRCSDGRLIVEWDKKSYHVMTTGFEAKDEQYMRLAKIDMHSFVTWHFLKLPGADALFSLPDEELKAKLKWLKSDEKRKHVRDFKCKRAVLGIGYGMQARKLYDMYREDFESEAEAKRLRAMIESIFPKVFRWQNQVRQLAHQQQYLKNRFGMIRWFFEVYVPDKKGGWTGGEQSEQAIAFLPASNAFGDMREIMKEMYRLKLDEKWSLCNTVHDSLVFLVEPKRLEEHCREMYPVLSAPSKVLIDPDVAPNGLIVDIEASAGESWADLKEVNLKEFGL